MNSFNINPKEIHQLLKTMTPFIKGYTMKKAMKINLEIVFKDGVLSMSIPNCKVTASCEMQGSGSVKIPFAILYQIVSKSTEKKLNISLLEDSFMVGNTSYKLQKKLKS